MRSIMQTVTLSEFYRIVKKGLEREQREVEPCTHGRNHTSDGRLKHGNEQKLTKDLLE